MPRLRTSTRFPFGLRLGLSLRRLRAPRIPLAGVCDQRRPGGLSLQRHKRSAESGGVGTRRQSTGSSEVAPARRCSGHRFSPGIVPRAQRLATPDTPLVRADVSSDGAGGSGRQDLVGSRKYDMRATSPIPGEITESSEFVWPIAHAGSDAWGASPTFHSGDIIQ